MFCSDCGKQVDQGTAFCPNCGRNLGVNTHIFPPKKKSGTKLLVIALIVIILVAGIVIVARNETHNVATAGTTTIIPSGDTIQLQPSSYSYYVDTFQSAVQVSGSFSTSYSVSLYIMTSSQFAQLSSAFGLPQFVATFSANKGQGSPTSVNWNLEAGQYYFVIFNPWPIQSTFTTSDGIKARVT